MPDTARLGIDWGKARIGVAASAAGTSFAFPVETVPAGAGEMARLAELVEEHRADVVYVGLPIDLRGKAAYAAEFVQGKAEELAARVAPAQLRMVDERLSTATASRTLGSVGKDSRSRRAIIDQAAAVEILQTALDIESRTSLPAGEVIEGEE